MSTSFYDTRVFGGDLTQALEFISNVLESSTEYSMIASAPDGTILLFNEGARRVYGYEPNEVVGKMKTDALHTPEEVSAGLPAKIVEVALAEGKWEGTIQRIRKDGERFTARVVKTPRRSPSGEVIGFLLISKDVSEEIRLTEQLRGTQYYTRSLIESNIDALMTTDTIGIITDVNQQMELLTGYKRDDLIGTPFRNYFTDPDRADSGIKQVLQEGRVTN